MSSRPIAILENCRSPVSVVHPVTFDKLSERFRKCDIGTKDGRAWMTTVDAVPTKHLTFNPITGEHESRTPTEKFIKGPIPLAWISRANALPGKAGAVAIAIWFLAGVNKSKTVKLTSEIERIAGCKRKALYAALNALEINGLISVSRIAGARHVVTLLDCQPRNQWPSSGSH